MKMMREKMYWETKRILEEAGYIHIMKFLILQKKGYESKHNLDCWNQKEYIWALERLHIHIQTM